MPASATARASSSSSRAALSSRPRRAASEGGAGGAPFSTKGARGKDADCPDRVRAGHDAAARRHWAQRRPEADIDPRRVVVPRLPLAMDAAVHREPRPLHPAQARSDEANQTLFVSQTNVVCFSNKRCLFLKQTLFVSPHALLHQVSAKGSVLFVLGSGRQLERARAVSGVIFGKGHIYRFFRLLVHYTILILNEGSRNLSIPSRLRYFDGSQKCKFAPRVFPARARVPAEATAPTRTTTQRPRGEGASGALRH